MLRTEADARKMVSYAKYPPLGIRGFGPPFAVSRLGLRNVQEYLLTANESLITIAQIETKEALANVDAIAAVPGVDVLLVGPSDLGNGIGHPILDGVMHDELKEGIMCVLEASQKHKKHACMYCASAAEAEFWLQKGFRMTQCTSLRA
ncbi:hypothetical protein B0A52_10331 [Exophiala mesophila]|uniref:HpcH/HpaI aldolase/citrate lyase domain-containing protein n=1 Tax=Exophiala mesophila TaxID=212818 RepID=A0A438MQC6_EXOME|nr:hypothetical protein B0A52_10331 [Exophiala mesophila]